MSIAVKVTRVRTVRTALRACKSCNGAGFVEWLSGSGCSVNGARCQCPIGRFDDVLAAHRVSRGFENHMRPAFSW